MALRFLNLFFLRVTQPVPLGGRDRDGLALGVVVLRHEVAVLRRQVTRPALQPADRPLLAGVARMLPRHRRRGLFVQPDTLLRWHRDLVRRRWAYPHRRPRRPSVPSGTVSLVLRLAKENPTRGYRRICAELTRWGITLAPRASGRSCAGIASIPRPGARVRLFERRHRLAPPLYILFFIELDTRIGHLAGITTNPAGAWVTQQVRNFCFGADRAGLASQVPDPRARREVRRVLRRRLLSRRRQGHQDLRPSTTGQRRRRFVGIVRRDA